MKTKIKFSDIAGMLERDEMKEIIGGCGNSYGSASFSPNPLGGSGGGGLSGFGGGTAIGSTFGGQPYAGYSNPVTNSFYGSSSSGSSGNTSGSTWQSTANGYTTTNATEISRILEFLNGQSNGQSIANFNPNISQIYSFVAGEMQFAAAGTIPLPNGTVWGGELNNVNVINNYYGPSTIPQGMVINNNGVLQFNFGGSGSSYGGSTISSVTIQQQTPTDCVFQSMTYLAGLYGNSSLNFNSMMNKYNSLYSGAISAGIIKPASGGVDAALLPSFADQYFNRISGITTTAQLSSFIAKGGNNFAIGTYSVGSSTGHAVVITGITSDKSQFICIDPQNNFASRNIPITNFTNFVATTGVCP